MGATGAPPLGRGAAGRACTCVPCSYRCSSPQRPRSHAPSASEPSASGQSLLPAHTGAAPSGGGAASARDGVSSAERALGDSGACGDATCPVSTGRGGGRGMRVPRRVQLVRGEGRDVSS